MRIGVDIRPFLSRETGVGTYLRHLLFELARIDTRNEYCLFSSSWKERFPPEKVPPFANLRFRDLRIPVRAVNFLWHRMSWPPFEWYFRRPARPDPFPDAHAPAGPVAEDRHGL